MNCSVYFILVHLKKISLVIFRTSSFHFLVLIYYADVNLPSKCLSGLWAAVSDHAAIWILKRALRM